MNVATRPARRLRAAAASLGFRSARGVLARKGLRLTADDTWCTLTARAPAEGPYREGALGAPGLWRPSLRPPTRPSTRRRRLEWDLPVEAVVRAELDDRAVRDELDAALVWAEESLAGRIANGTQESGPADDAPVAAEALIVECGALVARGELVRDGGRHAMRIPLETVPADLPPVRSALLDDVLDAVHREWRLVRAGRERGATREQVVAEVDLSGAPAALREAALPYAVDALKTVSRWLIETVHVLTRPELDLELWKVVADFNTTHR